MPEINCVYCGSMRLRIAGLERTIEAAKLELQRLHEKSTENEEFTVSDDNQMQRMIAWLEGSINPVVPPA